MFPKSLLIRCENLKKHTSPELGMENRDKILHDRLIKNHGTHKHYLDCYKIDKSFFKSHFKSRQKCLEENSQEFTVRV